MLSHSGVQAWQVTTRRIYRFSPAKGALSIWHSWQNPAQPSGKPLIKGCHLVPERIQTPVSILNHKVILQSLGTNDEWIYGHFLYLRAFILSLGTTALVKALLRPDLFPVLLASHLCLSPSLPGIWCLLAANRVSGAPWPDLSTKLCPVSQIIPLFSIDSINPPTDLPEHWSLASVWWKTMWLNLIVLQGRWLNV